MHVRTRLTHLTIKYLSWRPQVPRLSLMSPKEKMIRQILMNLNITRMNQYLINWMWHRKGSWVHRNSVIHSIRWTVSRKSATFKTLSRMTTCRTIFCRLEKNRLKCNLLSLRMSISIYWLLLTNMKTMLHKMRWKLK